MPYTSKEADPDLELYFRGPELKLKRFDSGVTTVTPQPADPSKWIKGRQFIYSGRFGLQPSQTYDNRVLFLSMNKIKFFYLSKIAFSLNTAPQSPQWT